MESTEVGKRTGVEHAEQGLESQLLHVEDWNTADKITEPKEASIPEDHEATP